MKAEKTESELKNYSAPWTGEVILACKRCQKKLRREKHPSEFSRLKKWFKNRGRQLPSTTAFHIIEIPCQNICPKHGVVVLSRPQLASRPPRFSILSSERQVERFYEALIAMKS
ncbi:hypothetical protein ACPOL_0239 [Acidisarcina polymorpha]|uniref:Uncharacterized protein n=1 Tax=Acidisarcina polymorpha TaxID=2211140 RepID=A0A2Z5FT20_9BACT|nr:hypothetical protein [Acidisarcina polymorpha]AXC09624.1 hypothetical protein ACPOL_0239 [Acidisarcina polymorpha]